MTGTIVILGTSHVSARSKREVEQAISHADVVAIELDGGRAAGMLSGERATFKQLREALGLRAAVIATVLRGFQERIGKRLGVVPGIEMKTALERSLAARKMVVLIDREIQVTITRLSKNLGWPEMRQICKDLFTFRKVSAHPSDDMVLTLLEEMKKSYPRLYTVMVRERDQYMAKQLLALHKEHPENVIVAIVGKGHVPGMHAILLREGTPVTVWTGSPNT